MRLFRKLSIYALMLVSVLMSCKKKGGTVPTPDPEPKPTVVYTENTLDFPNPERGFYRYTETHTSNFTTLNANTLKGYRQLQSIPNANYRVYSTLVFRYYVLDDVKTNVISQIILNKINEDMVAARTAGVKLIPRFVYTISSNSGNCSDGICPPYGDASKEYVLQHIRDLKPVLQNNADVIACVQIGFIGVWGEQYYTDFFGDPSSNGTQGKLIDINWKDRAEVIAALLDAVPKSRMVQVRYPQQKQRYIYGVSAPVTAAPMTDAEAFLENEKARIGFHNDCFLSGPNDTGTYEDYGNSSSNRNSSSSVVDALKDYKRKDSKYVVVGGETCNNTFSPDNDCEPAGKAQAAFAEMHYSYINAHYNNQLNNKWQTTGCMDNIKKNLGYRFVLQNATFPDAVAAGNNLNFTINLTNKGYASPYNARPVQLLLRKVGSQEVTILAINTDIRKWYTGAVKLESSVTIPANLAKGEYELLLNLPDAYESISARPEYSIRLANNNVWEEATGYNKLNYKIQVN